VSKASASSAFPACPLPPPKDTTRPVEKCLSVTARFDSLDTREGLKISTSLRVLIFVYLSPLVLLLLGLLIPVLIILFLIGLPPKVVQLSIKPVYTSSGVYFRHAA